MYVIAYSLNSPAKCYPSAKVKVKGCHIPGRHHSPGATQLSLEVGWQFIGMVWSFLNTL